MVPAHLCPRHTHTDSPGTLAQRVWEGTFLGRPAIVKQRFSKKYRHPALDAKLTVARLKMVRGLLGGSAWAADTACTEERSCC